MGVYTVRPWLTKTMFSYSPKAIVAPANLSPRRTAALEERMRPGNYSEEGFLGKDEKLIDVLLKDKVTLDRAGISYKTLVDLLISVMFVPEGHAATVNGQIYYQEPILYGGYQHCPYEEASSADCHKTDMDHILYQPHTGRAIFFSGLHPHLIEAHHFFEGEGTSYRLSPESIIELFNLKPGEKPKIIIEPSAKMSRVKKQDDILFKLNDLLGPEQLLERLKEHIHHGDLADIPPEDLAKSVHDVELLSASDHNYEMIGLWRIVGRLSASLFMSTGVVPIVSSDLAILTPKFREAAEKHFGKQAANRYIDIAKKTLDISVL